MLDTVSPSRPNSPTADYSTLLRLAAGSEGFRTELQADPRAALARCGFILAGDLVPSMVTLPAKSDLEQALADLGTEHRISPDTKWGGFFGS